MLGLDWMVDFGISISFCIRHEFGETSGPGPEMPAPPVRAGARLSGWEARDTWREMVPSAETELSCVVPCTAVVLCEVPLQCTVTSTACNITTSRREGRDHRKRNISQGGDWTMKRDGTVPVSLNHTSHSLACAPQQAVTPASHLLVRGARHPSLHARLQGTSPSIPRLCNC